MENIVPFDTGNQNYWFDINLSNKLHSYDDKNIKIENNINFGKNKYREKFCETYKFIDTYDIDFQYKPIEQIQPLINNKEKLSSFLEKTTKLEKQKNKAIDTATKNKKSESIIKSIITKYNKKINNVKKTTKTRKISLLLTDEQKKIISKWFTECERIYNLCIKLYSNDNNYFLIGYMKAKLHIFDIIKKENKIKYGNNNLCCPYDIATNEVKVFCSNLKSCDSNLKNNNIDNFVMKNKNTKKGQTIGIPKTAINKNGFYCSYLKSIISVQKFFENLEQKIILNDCSLQYDKKKNKYYLLICYNENIKTIEKREKFVALDPGESIFQTYFSEKGYGFIGKNIRKKILYIETKIRQVQSLLSKTKDSGSINHRNRLHKRFRQYYENIHNYVKELHNKTALYLCKNYERIMIPIFETKQMVQEKKKNKNIDKSIQDKFNKMTKNEKIKYIKNSSLCDMYTLLDLDKNGNKTKSPEIKEVEKILKESKTMYEKLIEMQNKTIEVLKEVNEIDLILKTEDNVKKVKENAKSVNKELHTIKNKSQREYIEKNYGIEMRKEYDKKQRKKQKLNKRVKFVLLRLSHYQFKQHLINKGNEYGCLVLEVTEEYTSKTCTKCGQISNKFEGRTKICEHCGYKLNRDLGGSRNIAIKNLKKIIKGLTRGSTDTPIVGV